MSRRNLTSNRRSFRKNPRTFLDKVSEQPISITINDGVNPEYTIVVSSQNGTVQNQQELEDLGLSTSTKRVSTNKEDEFIE